jgi:hypothetical protein
VTNVEEENRESFVAEVRAYLEEQKSKSATERNARQISGGTNITLCLESSNKGTSEIIIIFV